MATPLAILYGLILGLLGVYLHRVIALSIHARMQRWHDPLPTASGDLPTVTVQLPIYNEKALVYRLINAVCALDYPQDMLEIQVLDDSTDETTTLIAQAIQPWRQRGLMINHVRRPDRRGHKAGNLAHGLPLAMGEFIAIFDADFVPEPDWLHSAVAHFQQPGSERLGLVQTQWSHLNADQSPLTAAQNVAVDQFAMAQTTRIRLGLWSSFYGSAGLWRRSCIEDSGGWSSDTFSEDLNMAYSAQLHGWSLGYDGRLLASAELPATMLAYKQQQFFWSKGNMQVVRLLWHRLLSSAISPLKRIDAVLFATWPMTHLLLLLRVMIQLLLLIWPSPSIMYLDLVALVILSGCFIPTIIDWLRGRKNLPMHLNLGIGISVNNTVGLLVGLFGPIGEDFRATTPKSGGSDQRLRRNGLADLIILGELVFAALVLTGSVIAFHQGRWLLILMLLHDVIGFGWVGGQSLWEVLRSNASQRAEMTQ